MERIIIYTITEQQENLCIIDFLKQQGFSRHILRSMKDFPGSILLNGQPFQRTRSAEIRRQPAYFCSGNRSVG